MYFGNTYFKIMDETLKLALKVKWRFLGFSRAYIKRGWDFRISTSKLMPILQRSY